MAYKVKGKCVYKKDTGAKVGCTKGSIDKYLAALNINANESISETNKIKGGKSDKLTPEDISKKFGVSLNSIEKQIEKGINVEKEHTNSEKLAREIAMDHISEIPDYYDRLDKMEKDAKKDLKTESIKPLIKKLLFEYFNGL